MSNLSDNFIEYLEKLRDREDRGALAALRRGLGRPPGEATEMYPYIFCFAGIKSLEEKDYFLVASLFALHPDKGGNGYMGSVFLRIKQLTNSDSIEQRFVALLNSDKEDLPIHLRHAVALAKGKDIPINWGQLLKDIRCWDHEARFVQRNWARDFWATDNVVA